jgi:hypothetical protein
MTLVLFSGPPVFPQGLSGWFDITNNTSEGYEEGEKISASETFNRNMSLNYQQFITPMLSYQLNLRANLSDSDITDMEGEITTTYRRSIEPALDLILSNPMYDLSTGYRRYEQWTTAHYSDDSRTTKEFYYSRLNLSPEKLPSLSVQFDKQRNFDYLSPKELDLTNTAYSLTSTYELPSRDMVFRYTINYSYTITQTPLSLTNKSIRDNFNSGYNIGYSGNLWNDKADYSLNYQGNYSRIKNEQFVSQTGSVTVERLPLGGLYGKGTDPSKPQEIVLSDKGSLVDDKFDSTGINLSNDTLHNIGIMVSSAKTVDRLFIYVNKDIRGDTVLSSTNNWSVFKSDVNQATTWTKISIKKITLTDVDIVNNVFRYEIEFSAPQSASFFKAININTSSVLDVEVTEIEAYGTDEIPQEDKLTDVVTSFTQEVNLNTSVRPSRVLTFSFAYSVSRSDQNPVSLIDSISGVFTNLFSDSVSGENSGFKSNITRNYSASTVWLTHRLLTTTLRIQRSEVFDNLDETDVSTNSYSLSFGSAPLPTVDTSLSLIKSDSYRFNEKETANNSVLFSIGSALYRDVNMVTDIGYTRSHSLINETSSSSTHLSGSIDAVLTRKLTGMINYSFIWNSSSDGSSSDTKEGSTIITYRPGQFINITSTLSASSSDGDVTTTEGILIDWLPLKVIRLNMSYHHSDSDTEPTRSDSLSSYAIWYITKFADVRFTYSYTVQVRDEKTKNYNFNTSLNCRF